jgi:hypothetical protein
VCLAVTPRWFGLFGPTYAQELADLTRWVVTAPRGYVEIFPNGMARVTTYVERYAVRLPKELCEHAARAGYQAPDHLDVDAVSETPYSFAYWAK